MRSTATLAALALAPWGLGACVAATGAEPPAPEDVTRAYRGIETVLLDDDLVNFRVAMDTNAADPAAEIDAYARCAAAQYALIRGYGFARHVRTTTARKGTTWQGDAVYTISPALPRGLRTIDAEVTVRDCGEQGIPTV